MYVDMLRVRNPGDISFFEPPHLDDGGIERWADVTYRHVYRKILEEFDMESYDPFEVDYRYIRLLNQTMKSYSVIFPINIY